MDQVNRPLEALDVIKRHSTWSLIHDSAQAPIKQQNDTAKVGIFNRLGLFSVFILFAGLAAILGSIAFLCFLWIAGDDNASWRQISLSGWTTRSITLASLMIRLAVTAQAGLCTSILAAIALRRAHVLLPSAPAVALMQFENTGPHSLVLPLYSSVRRGRGWVIGALLIALLISTTLLQITSTILLSDVSLYVISGLEAGQRINYGFDGNSSLEVTFGLEMGYWSKKPAQYATFAEYNEPPVNYTGVHDTGLTMRAFLPVYPQFQRELLKSYNGHATLVDSRVVCMKPALEDLTLSIPKIWYPSAPRLSGRIGTYQEAPRFEASDNFDRLRPFNCAVGYAGAVGYNDPVEWPLTVCRLNQTSGIRSAMDNNTYVFTANSFDMEAYMTDGPGQAFLVMNMTGSYGRWANYSYSGYGPFWKPPVRDYLKFADPNEYRGDGEWLVIPSNDTEIQISMSICYSAFRTADRNIQALSSQNRTEPSIAWDPATSRYNTSSIRNQLTISNTTSLDQRGVLALEPLQSWSFDQLTALTTPVFLEADTYIGTSYANYDFSEFLCLTCTTPDNTRSFEIANQELTAVFNDIVRETRHPATALQAVYTTLFGMVYYNHVFQFDYPGNATIASFAQSLAPTGSTGFIAVCVVLGLHLFVVGLILAIFAGSEGKSLIGSAWSVLAQLGADDIERWTSIAASKRDGEAVAEMKRAGVNEDWAGLRITSKGYEVVRREIGATSARKPAP